jgi:hypothetical protein
MKKMIAAIINPSFTSISFQSPIPRSMTQGMTIHKTDNIPIPNKLKMAMIKTLSFIIDFHPHVVIQVHQGIRIFQVPIVPVKEGRAKAQIIFLPGQGGFCDIKRP